MGYDDGKSKVNIVMSHPQNEARITARIPLSVKATLQQAADLSGATLNQFLVQAALKEAFSILEAERTITLSERDAELVFSLLENPLEPNTRLKEAVRKHTEWIRETN